MKFYVSRQSYWGVEPNEQYCVEIAEGGLNYANCDMLVSKYQEEGEYYHPIDAVEAAISVRNQWQKDEPKLNIRIDYGFTGGYTMPFLSENKDDELREWAKQIIEKMPKCDRCGKPYEDNSGWTHEFADGYIFCSELCADKDYYSVIAEDGD